MKGFICCILAQKNLKTSGKSTSQNSTNQNSGVLNVFTAIVTVLQVYLQFSVTVESEISPQGDRQKVCVSLLSIVSQNLPLKTPLWSIRGTTLPANGHIPKILDVY